MDHTRPVGTVGDDGYRQAVERAGVIELPDDGEPPPGDHLADLLNGRFEDNDPPGAPR